MARAQLDSLDYKILHTLSSNGRKPYLEIARECGVSGAAIHQRIQKLTAMGVLKGSECLIDAASVGYDTCAYIGFFLKDPSKFDRASPRNPRSSGSTLHHRTVRHVYQTICSQQRPPAPPHPRRAAGARPGPHRVTDIIQGGIQASASDTSAQQGLIPSVSPHVISEHSPLLIPYYI